MYTYACDANVSGGIDGDDFHRIDQGFSNAPGGYANGDFNYSGAIDADDYWLIDRNYGRDLPALSASLPIGVTSVPEPTSAGLLFGTESILVRRRRSSSITSAQTLD